MPQVTLIDPRRILRTEYHFEEKIAPLMDKICSEGIWSVPLTVEETSLALMDGHHRLQVALTLGLDFVPCVLLDYTEVAVVTRRPDIAVTPEEIINRGLSGNLYPQKTTRHIFKEAYACHFPISDLKFAQAA